MRKLEHKTFEIKALNYNDTTKELIVDGYAAIFDIEDSLNPSWNPNTGQFVMAKDVIHKGAFTKTISEQKDRIKFCKNHCLENPVGKPLEIKEDVKGLFTSSRVSDAEEELKTKIREGIFTEMSVGYVVVKCEFTQLSDGTFIRDIYEVKLYEYSIVTLARNENAKITELKHLVDADELITGLLKEEKNEEKKFKLLQIQSLLDGESIKSLTRQEPMPKKEAVDFSKMSFK